MKTNIIFIGMPGVGKTTIGKHLSKSKNCDFYDTDKVLTDLLGVSLQEYINNSGIQKFREAEEHILKEKFQDINNSVISTGGSVVYSDSGMKSLQDIGIILYLENDFEIIKKRLSYNNNRGLVIKPGQTLLDLYHERVPLYEKYADIKINCFNKSIYDIVEEIDNKRISNDKIFKKNAA